MGVEERAQTSTAASAAAIRPHSLRSTAARSQESAATAPFRAKCRRAGRPAAGPHLTSSSVSAVSRERTSPMVRPPAAPSPISLNTAGHPHVRLNCRRGSG